MRAIAFVLLLCVGWVSVGHGAPSRRRSTKSLNAKIQKRKPPVAKPPVPQAPSAKPPSATVEAQLAKLEAEVRQAQVSGRGYDAVPTLRRLYALQQKHLGPGEPRTSMTRVQLAALLLSAGGYREAAGLYKEGLVAAERLHSADSLEVVTALQGLLGVYWVQGRYPEADALYQRLVPLWKKHHGGKSMVYGAMLLGYGAFLNAWSAYGAAQRVYEEALQAYEAAVPSPDDPQLIPPLQAMAWSLWATGQHRRASALFDRLLALNDRRPATEAAARAATLYSVGSVYHYGGKPELARPLFARAREVYAAQIADKERAGAKGHELSSPYTMLAMMEKSLGDLEAARRALERAIAIEEKAQQGSAWYSMLAEIERAAGRPAAALALLDKAEAHLLRVAGPSMKGVYASMRAEALRDLGRHDEAEQVLRAYLARQVATMGPTHPMVGTANLLLAATQVAAQRFAAAEESLGRGLDLAERELALVLATGSEADHAVYFSRNAYVQDLAVNLHASHARTSRRAAELALTTVLRRKGRILDASAGAMAALRGRLGPDDLRVLDELDEARAKLAKLIVAGATATDPEAYAKQVAALESQARELEERIRKRNATYRAISQPISLAAVQAEIPADTRLVELVSYQPQGLVYDAKNLAPRRYVAFVVARKGPPQLVDLAPVAELDEAVEKFRAAVADPDDERVLERGRALYALTLGKISPHLGGATKLALAPDGQLNLVPFAALVDPTGAFVVQKLTITYLTSGRELLRGKVTAKPRQRAMIFADPAFDGEVAAAGAPADASRGRRSRDLTIPKWQRLPGTGQEAEAISRLLRGATLVRGAAATESAVKRVLAPVVLHVATHGFFLSRQRPEESGAQERGAAVSMPGVPTAPSVVGAGAENPLLRSGLALAGANKLRSDDDDGILTALEASGLDLWGTRLVVLSACETGVGTASHGDGVYGLRRALVIAGAESLVMSLWQVDDTATRDLMTRFYRMLERGDGRSEALRSAQLEMLARPASHHPYYWAAFQPAGASGPIKEWR